MSSFSKDAAKVASAPLITQLLSILLTPIVTRLYSPEAFGLFQLFGSVCAPLVVFVTMGYAVPIMITESEEERVNLLFICILISLLFSTIIGFVFVTGYNVLNTFLKIDQIKIIVWILPLSLLFHGIYMSLRYWNLKKTKFQQNAFGEIFRNIGNYFIILPAGFMGYTSANSLIFGSFVSSITTILAQSIGQIKSLFNNLWHNVNYKQIKYLLVRYRKFPLYNTPSEFLSRFSSETPVILFAFFFSSNVIGFYSLSLRILNLPVKYLGTTIGDVYFQRGSLDKTGNVHLLKKLLKLIFMIGLPFFSMLSIIGSDLFGFFFGQVWRTAGQYSQILSFYIFLKLLINFACYLTNILEKQQYYLIYVAVDALLISVGITVGGILHNIILSLTLILLLSGCVSVIFGYYIYSSVGISMKDLWLLFRKPFYLIFPFILINLLLIHILHLPGLINLIISITFLFINYLLLLLFDSELKGYVRRAIGYMKNRL